jgi:DNA-binding CsgD family transcriptional regulator
VQLMTDTYPEIEPHSALTERQVQVVGLLVQGSSIKQIARCLGISPRTVKKHLTTARLALGAETRDHLVALAVSRKLVEMENG